MATTGDMSAALTAQEDRDRGFPTRLAHGTLSLFDTTVIATASVAPAYSLAATMALLVAAVGLSSPAALIVSFVPVLTIAIAYYYMNRRDPDCGASFAWVSRTVSPYVGWFTGWVQVCANTLFLIAAPVLAGANTLTFLNTIGVINSNTASSTVLTAVVGFLWLALVTAMVIYGIRLTANFQWVLLGIEYLVVLVFSILAFIKIATVHPAGSQGISPNWFNPFSLQSLAGLAGGAVLGVFFFWGWDTAANVNEESKDSEGSPGYAGILSMFVLLFIFLLNATAIQALLPANTIQKQGASVLYYFAQQLAPAPLAWLMVLAVLSSTVATCQTTLLPASRLTLSMARFKTFPGVFARIHPRWRTPAIGTLILGIISAVGIVLTSWSPTVNSTFQNLIADLGVLVAFYYGVTGLACAWAYRRILFRSVWTLLLAGILPVLGGLFLFWIGFQVVQSSGLKGSLPILITFVLGIPLLIIARLVSKGDFFTRRIDTYDEEPARATRVEPA